MHASLHVPSDTTVNLAPVVARLIAADTPFPLLST